MYLISSLERARALARLVGPAQRAARLLRPGRVRDALHGVWLGHPLHPVLAQAPAGTWPSASLLDAWPGSSPGTAAASRRLVLAGLAAALPAALAGSADWSELHEQQMRVGVVHALANTAAVALYAASLAAPDRTARGLRLVGLTAVAAGGLLGGHLAFRQSAGANQAEPVPHLIEPGWHDLMTAAELAGLAAGQPARRTLGDVPVVVVRDEQGVYVLADRCSHYVTVFLVGRTDRMGVDGHGLRRRGPVYQPHADRRRAGAGHRVAGGADAGQRFSS